MGERVAYRHGWDHKKDKLIAKGVRYETVDVQERRRGGRPAAASSSVAVAGAQASSGSAARSVPASAREPISESVSSSSEGEVVNMSMQQGDAPTVDIGGEMQRLGKKGAKRAKKAVQEAQEEAQKGRREGREEREASQEQSRPVQEDPGVDDEQGVAHGARLGRGRE